MPASSAILSILAPSKPRAANSSAAAWKIRALVRSGSRNRGRATSSFSSGSGISSDKEHSVLAPGQAVPPPEFAPEYRSDTSDQLTTLPATANRTTPGRRRESGLRTLEPSHDSVNRNVHRGKG